MYSQIIPPSVTIITPTTQNRERFNALCAEYGDYQDYTGSIEHLFDYGKDSIGAKRNRLVEAAKGQIIVHMDSDDFYARDWVRKSVQFLLDENRSVTGLSSAYFFHRNGKSQLYQYRGSQFYAIGATLCYTKEVWAKGKFKDTSNGEDTFFLEGKNVKQHQHIESFCATVHGNNTSGDRKYFGASFSLIKKEIPQMIMGDYFKEYYKY